MESVIIGLLSLAVVLLCIGWVIKSLIRGLQRGFAKAASLPSKKLSSASKPTKRPYVLNASVSKNLVDMPEVTSRPFTYQDERRAAEARQRVWIRYEDRSGNVTERSVEIYQPEDDEVLFTWCCLKREPRTFARRNIQSWRLLPERFAFDPIVDQYWEEEGTRDMSEKVPWRRWLEDHPDDIADRY